VNNLSKIRWIFVFVFITLQIVSVRFLPSIHYFPDFLFLIIAFNALKAGFFKSYAVACILGWLTDYLTGGIIGVFGFSRVLSAAILHEMVKVVDLKRKGFTFFLIFFSLLSSNLISYLFLYLIDQAHLSLSLILWQPISTAVLALFMIHWKSVNKIWDVY
jgi:rod shape-determining protein MreD